MKKIMPLILIAAAITAAVYYQRANTRAASGEAAYSGVVEATEVTLSAEIPGRILEVAPREGDSVTEGDVLVKLDAATLEAQLEQAVAARSVAAGQAAAVKAGILNAKSNLARSDNLFKAGSISEQQLDTVGTQTDVLKGQQDAAGGGIRQAEATAKYIREQIAKAVVTAPLTGVVLTRAVEPGEMAMPGTALLTIADLDHAWVRLFLPETLLGRVRLGQVVKLSTDSYPGKTYDGKITYISDKAEFTPKNVQTKEERVRLVYAIKVSVDNSSGELKIGMPVDANLE